jgi:phosphopantothenoylcysteine synthetase/decarboxylase
MKVLITAGGTEEHLDGVRRLTNTSTGATGLALAKAFAAAGADVVLLHAERVPAEGVPVKTISYLTFGDLESALREQLGNHRFDAVIHLAAVSDYRLESVEIDGETVDPDSRGKIGSGHELVLRLAPNPKLIDGLKRGSLNPELVVVGFKLTDDPDPAARRSGIDALLDRGVADLVVHNDIREIGPDRHRARIYGRSGKIAETTDKNGLAHALIGLLCQGGAS